MIKNNGWQKTFDKLCNFLSNESKVYYSRFGDGDFNIMSGIGGELYHSYSPELQKELIDAFIIENSNYIKGVMLEEPIFTGGELSNRENTKDEQISRNFIESCFSNKDTIIFDSHVVLTYIAICHQEKFIDFLNKFIRPKKKLFVGSVEKEKIEKLIGKVDYYVNVPCEINKGKKGLIGAYYSNHIWWPKVLKYVDDVELVLPSAGMAGRVITKRLWHMNKNLQCIELGSVVDGATGIESRSIWKRNDNINKLKKLLLKEV